MLAAKREHCTGRSAMEIKRCGNSKSLVCILQMNGSTFRKLEGAKPTTPA
jgi:hypothetical protein